VLEIPRTFVEICRSVQDGTFEPREYELTVANGHTSLVINPRLKSAIPKAVLDEIESLKEQLRSGRLKVERAHF
jgi:basic membrane lipoprotein Med (substrate-binding protein (PBP1-ABC) superfamily)